MTSIPSCHEVGAGDTSSFCLFTGSAACHGEQVLKSASTPAPVVIKYGGNAMTDPALRAAMAAEIARVPGAVVVHGGGPFIGAALAEAGLSSRFVRGLRVTDAASLPVLETTLTMLGKELAQALGRGVGLTGRDAGLLVAETFDAALGRVGKVTAVNRELLAGFLGLGLIPVIACLAVDVYGDALNVNADDAAGAVAGALGAPVVFLSNIPGVLDDPADPDSLITTLHERDVQARIEDGRILGGMIPKVEAALEALSAGAAFAVIADGRKPKELTATLAGTRGTRVIK